MRTFCICYIAPCPIYGETVKSEHVQARNRAVAELYADLCYGTAVECISEEVE